MSLKQKILVAIMGAGLTLAGAASASATPWQNAHPRRVEVNHRLAHQDMRINRAERQGRVGPRQAAYLHRQDHMIRHEERTDAHFNNGHITRREQAQINRQENQVSGQIYRDGH